MYDPKYSIVKICMIMNFELLQQDIEQLTVIFRLLSLTVLVFFMGVIAGAGAV